MGRGLPEVMGFVKFSLDILSSESALYRASFGVRGAFSAIAANLGPEERLALAQQLFEVQMQQLLEPGDAVSKVGHSAGRDGAALKFLYLPLASSPWPMLSRMLKDRRTSFGEAALTGLGNSEKSDLDRDGAGFRHRLSAFKAVAANSGTNSGGADTPEPTPTAAAGSATPVDPDSALELACWTGALNQQGLKIDAAAAGFDKPDASLQASVQAATEARQARATDRNNAHLPKGSGKPPQTSDQRAPTSVISGRDDAGYDDVPVELWDRKAENLLTLTRVLAPDELVARELRLAAACTMIGKWIHRAPEVLKVKRLCHQYLPTGPLREQSLVLRATALCHLVDGAWGTPDALLDFLPPLPVSGSAREDAIALHAAAYRKLAHFDFSGTKQRRDRYELFRAQLSQLPQHDRDALLGPLQDAFSDHHR